MNTSFAVAVVIAAAACSSCARRHDGERALYQPIAAVESTYGPLIAAGNHPTADPHGTGERVGLFRDASGSIWGLPLSFDRNDAVLACAPPALRAAKVTDGFDAGSSVIASTNQPTGWRGGSGEIELLLRDPVAGVMEFESAALRVDGAICRLAAAPDGPDTRSPHLARSNRPLNLVVA
jgi:hypothetical protein